MNFDFTEEQISIRVLARGILEREMTAERIKAVESGERWFDSELWRKLADAGLLGIAVPSELGGMGFGLLETCTLLQEIGRAVAPVPALPTLLLAGLSLAELGTHAQKERWLVPMAAGESILTAALLDGDSTDPMRPAARARRRGSTWVLEGRKKLVPAADLAQRVLVPAVTSEGSGIFLLDPRAEGVVLTRNGASTGEPLFDLELSRARADSGDVLAGDARGGAEKVGWLYPRALIGACAMQLGVSERALEMTARYVCERVQFGVPIGSFQAVQHRLAEAYIDLEAMRWVTWRAAWKLERGESAMREAIVAKFWAAEGGSRIANAAQHLHGGMGADLDYPVHRYFVWSKALELGFGAAAPQLAALGRDMARTGPEVDT